MNLNTKLTTDISLKFQLTLKYNLTFKNLDLFSSSPRLLAKIGSTYLVMHAAVGYYTG